MVSGMFAVYDLKAKAFMQPFFSSINETAVRAFSHAVNNADGNSMLSRNPEDFILYRVGEFEDESGLLKPLAQPEQLVLAAQLKGNGHG